MSDPCPWQRGEPLCKACTAYGSCVYDFKAGGVLPNISPMENALLFPFVLVIGLSMITTGVLGALIVLYFITGILHEALGKFLALLF